MERRFMEENALLCTRRSLLINVTFEYKISACVENYRAMNFLYTHLEELLKRGMNLRKTYTSDALNEVVTFTQSKFYVWFLQIRSKIKFPLCSHNKIRRVAA